MESVKDLVAKMTEGGKLNVRTPIYLSWGSIEECRRLFEEIFREVDKSIGEYNHLEEYDQIVEWMSNTKGYGLVMMGDCGRGKSVIATGVIPVLLQQKRKASIAIHADEFNKPYPFASSTMGYNPKMTNLDYLLRVGYPIIDELGVEPRLNDYGERYEGFNQIINVAERYLRPIIITTNLTEEELIERYGDRTFDRLTHLCRIVKFRGESLR